MYQEGLLALGARLEADHLLAAAGHLYNEIAHSDAEHGAAAGLRARAQTRLDALTGVGSSAYRTEFLLRRIARETMEPTTLVGMTAASAAYRLTRLAFLSRLVGSPAGGLLTRGFGARATASLMAFGVEATVFPMASRGAAAAFGRDLDWSLGTVGREIAGSFLLLGAMKLAGFGSAGLYNRMVERGVAARAASLRPVAQSLLQQGGMLAGLTLGHHLETAAGIRPHQDGATTFVDSLAMLIQFNAAGRLAHGIMGPGYAAWERSLDLHANRLAPARRPLLPPRGRLPSLDSLRNGALAPAAAGEIRFPRPALPEAFNPNMSGRPLSAPELPTISQMSAGNGNGPETPSDGVIPAIPRTTSRSGQHIIMLMPESGEPLEISLRRFIDMEPHAVAVFQVPDGERIGEVLVTNEKVESLLGYTTEEAMQRSILEFFNARDSRVYTALLKKFPHEQSLPLRDIQLLRKDGTTVWCDVDLSIANFNGRRLGFAFIENVTARHEAKERLESAEARNQALIDAFPDNIFRINRDMQFLDVRAKYEHGLSVPDAANIVEGGTVGELDLPPGLVQLGVSTIARAFESGNLERAEYTIPFSDGSLRYQEARVKRSGPDEVIIIVRDITELKQATLENERLLQIIENSGDFISMSTPEGRIFYHNAAARNLMGHPEGTDIRSLTPVDIHPEWALNKILKEGVPTAIESGVWIGETALRHVSGREVPVHQMILANRGPEGEISHFSTIIRDITDLKRVQDARVAQSRLDAIKLMSRGLAHDGNNAITPLEPYLKLVETYLNDTNERINSLNGLLTKDPATVTVDEVRRLQFQLNGLKDSYETHHPMDSIAVAMNASERIRGMFARFRALTAEPVPAPPLDLHNLLRRPSLELQPHLGDDVRLDIRTDTLPFKVRIAREQMNDVLQNLLVNARDAMNGRPDKLLRIETARVTLSAETAARLLPHTQSRSLNPGDYLRLTVTDTGTGMTESTRRQIFTPYFSTKHKSEGHGGIGLALVQKYVEDAGGFIAVRSTVGLGTSFELYFPPAEQVRPPRTEAVSGRIYETPILLVDDEPNLLHLAVQSFRNRGFRTIHQAKTGNEALEILKNNPDIGFLLTDIELPGAPGTRLVRDAKLMNPRMAMVLWTGKDPKPYEAYLNRFGEAVGKPIDLDEVMERAEVLMERSFAPDPE